MSKLATRALVLVSAVLGVVLIAPGVSTARNAGSELLVSACSFQQIDRAAHRVAPFEATFYWDANPPGKLALLGWFYLPMNERFARRDAIESKYPGVFEPRTYLTDSPRSIEHQRQLEEIVDTCNRY